MTPQFPRIFLWHMVRPWWRHPLLALLNVLSVALGIAVFLAIQIANQSANRSFAAGIDLVAGKAQLEIRGDVDETVWPLVAQQPGIKAVTGVVEGTVTFPDWPGEYLHLVGVDLFSGESFRTFAVSPAGQAPPLEKWMGQKGVVALTGEFAQRYHIKVGDRLKVIVNSEPATLEVGSLIDSRGDASGTPSRMAVLDLGWAQELLNRQGRLSSLQILVDDPSQAAAIAEQLNRVLPPGLHAESPRQRSFQIETMLSAFQLNLTALSMVSLLVGVFLIYNTISASVARRRSEIGILRSIGMTRNEVRGLFLGEAALFGVCGIVLGSVGGVALATVLSKVVARTISSLYLLVRIEHLSLEPRQFVLATLFGLGAVLAGAWLPASEAARVNPVDALSLGNHAGRAIDRVPRLGFYGIVLLGLALLISRIVLQSQWPAGSFVAAFLVLAGFAFFAPFATWRFGFLASGVQHLGVLWRLAADHLRQSIHRHAVTVAALAAAVAMMISLLIMIFSFRQSVNAWIDRGIVADLFIAPASNDTIGLEAMMPEASVTWLRSRPEPAGVDTFRELFCDFTLPPQTTTRSARLVVVEGGYRKNLSFVGGDDERKMARVFHENCVAITEPFARKNGAKDGDHVIVSTPRGQAEFEIAGTYSDYTRDQGLILMSRENFDRWWNDPRVQSLAVYLRPGADGGRLSEDFQRQFSGGGEFVIFSNRALRQRILGIFDQTFAVTYILRSVAVIVAMLGTFLALTTLVTERGREIGMLRAIGASRGQVQQFLMIEAGMIGTVATVLGMVTGLALAFVLIWVVNPAFFGWTIALHFPWLALLATPLWIVPAALIAAWYPAWRASRNLIATAVREE